MMVEIQHSKIAGVIRLLSELSLKGKQSRHRSKFIKLLDDRLTELEEDESNIRKEHCHLDDDGEPKTTNDGASWDVKEENQKDFENDILELREEQFVITGGDKTEYMKTVKVILDECDKEFSGQEAALYDYLYDQIEQVK